MTTSSTTSFNLDVNLLIEEAFERCGAELRTGYDFRTARRSLNLLTIEWANKGINLWTIEQGQTDININRISADTYLTIPNKNAQGRPIQVWINRQSGAQNPSGVQAPNINVWPAPDQNNFYTFVYFRLRRIQDAGEGVTTQDIPFRMLPAMVAGLAYHLSLKIPGALERSVMLKGMYDEAWEQAADEDREKAPLRLAPRQMFY